MDPEFLHELDLLAIDNPMLGTLVSIWRGGYISYDEWCCLAITTLAKLSRNYRKVAIDAHMHTVQPLIIMPDLTHER